MEFFLCQYMERSRWSPPNVIIHGHPFDMCNQHNTAQHSTAQRIYLSQQPILSLLSSILMRLCMLLCQFHLVISHCSRPFVLPTSPCPTCTNTHEMSKSPLPCEPSDSLTHHCLLFLLHELLITRNYQLQRAPPSCQKFSIASSSVLPSARVVYHIVT